MTVALTKDSIDFGIVVQDGAKALAFYRDLLGFKHIGDTPMGGGSTMHRLLCGTSQIKVIEHAQPPASPPPGGIAGGAGYRYWTVSVSNLDGLVDKVREAGVPVVWEPREIRPGVRIAMVEDPDGNWVEFLESSG